ncbi:YchJ family metal-binding protein [Microbacterium sp. BWT-B31]|uniref:YchJ family protein n=1 Tax=Microbacterium sp. BWT-B31 TaxID=3232072 RepID=UPI00352974C8
MDDASRCPCGTGETYGNCCGPLHAGAPALTAERLMRSRYSAFVVGDAEYLLRSWHPSTRPDRLELDPAQRWLHLEIVDRRGGGLFDRDGEVEFIATFRLDGRRHELRERSGFVRDGAGWAYVTAV